MHSHSIDVIITHEAPRAVCPSAQAIRAGGFVFCSAQAALDPETGRLVEGGIVEQTRRVLHNLRLVLAASGCSTDRIVKTTVYLADWNDAKAMNEAYEEFFRGGHLPARSTVQGSRWPSGSLVAIEAVAFTM